MRTPTQPTPVTFAYRRRQWHGPSGHAPRYRGAIVEDTDVRLDIDAAGTQPADVERQPDHAVSITAAQIGLHHQASDGLRVRLRQASGNECARYKIDELCGGNPPFWSRHFLYCCVLIHFQSLLKLIRGK